MLRILSPFLPLAAGTASFFLCLSLIPLGISPEDADRLEIALYHLEALSPFILPLMIYLATKALLQKITGPALDAQAKKPSAPST